MSKIFANIRKRYPSDTAMTRLVSSPDAGDVETIKLIISLNRDEINNCDSVEKKNLLHWACLLSNFNLVQLLIASGADVNAVCTEHGATGLHYLCRTDSKDEASIIAIARSLLSCSPRPNLSVIDKNELTALEIARRLQKHFLVRFLEEANAASAAVGNTLSAATTSAVAAALPLSSIIPSPISTPFYSAPVSAGASASEAFEGDSPYRLCTSTSPRETKRVYSLRSSECKASNIIHCLVDVIDVDVRVALATHGCSLLHKLKKDGDSQRVPQETFLHAIDNHFAGDTLIEDDDVSGPRTVVGTERIFIRGVSPQGKLSIRMYTVHDPVRVYQKMNAALNQNDRYPTLMQESLLYMKGLIKGLHEFSTAEGGKFVEKIALGYRGMYIQNNHFLKAKVEATMKALELHMEIPTTSISTLAAAAANVGARVVPYKIGEPITFTAFTSVSAAAYQADKYSDHLVFFFHDVVGLNIEVLSAYPAEKEILLPPPSLFEITDLSTFPNKQLLVVHLKQVRPDASYLPFSPYPDVPQDHNLRMIFADESNVKEESTHTIDELHREIARLTALNEALTLGSPSPLVDFENAFLLLSNSRYAENYDSLEEFLNRQAIFESGDLQYATPEVLQNITAMLKPNAQVKFKRFMGM